MIAVIKRTTIYSELISGNYSNVIKCVFIFYCKSNKNLQSHSNHIVFNCNFQYSLDYIHVQYFEYRTIFSQIYWIKEYTGFYSHWHRMRTCILRYSCMHCISSYSSIFHPRIKTFISGTQLCFTQWYPVLDLIIDINIQMILLVIYVEKSEYDESKSL